MTSTSLDLAFSTIAERSIPGATLLRHRPLKGGVSAAVHALELSTAAGPASLVVRRHGAATWKPLASDVTQSEFALLTALHRAGLPVPKPLLLDVSAQLLPSPFFVMELIAGSSEIAGDFLDSALRQMAAFLASLHALDIEALRLPRLPAREDPVQGALDCLPANPERAQLRDRIASYRAHADRPALLHGDFWPGNLLWKDARLAAVLDWEDAAIGSRASDVACCRAELNALFGMSAARAFTDYYRAAHQGELSDLALWDVYVGSAALATLHDWGLPAEVEAQRRERTSTFVGEAAEMLTGTD